ncbi:MAG: hypothetical protein AAF938_06750 [Myxococcota bacterium]
MHSAFTELGDEKSADDMMAGFFMNYDSVGALESFVRCSEQALEEFKLALMANPADD